MGGDLQWLSPGSSAVFHSLSVCAENRPAPQQTFKSNVNHVTARHIFKANVNHVTLFSDQ